jgi:hypothetical protein
MIKNGYRVMCFKWAASAQQTDTAVVVKQKERKESGENES